MNGFYLVLFVALASFVLTAALRKYALAKSLIDVPNARSSHSVPTPRGGGLAIVVSLLVGLVVVIAAGGLHWREGLALIGAGGVVAVQGRDGGEAVQRLTKCIETEWLHVILNIRPFEGR